MPCSWFLLFLMVWLAWAFRILKNNQLIGPIPSTLSQIPNLKILWVSISAVFSSSHILKYFPDHNSLSTVSRDLAQNKLSGEIPRLIYWNEVLQYLWVCLIMMITEIFFALFYSTLNRYWAWELCFKFSGLRGNNLVGTLSPDMCQLTGLWYL